jgi:hypothetical protein
VHDDREPAAGRVVVVDDVGGCIIIDDLVRLNVIGQSDDVG